MNPFQNTNIQVTKVEMKVASTGNVKYILTAQDGKKYFFYQKAKGVDCDVFQTFQNMGVKQGMTIAIGFAEEPKSFQNPKGETVNYVDRFIGSIREASGVPASLPTSPQKTAVKSNLSEPAYVEPKSEAFWNERGRRLALHGFINARLVNNPISQVEQEIDQLLKLEDKIDAKLLHQVKTFGTDQMPCNEEAPLPEYPYVEPTDSDLGIPF